jgi:hypothetical protein
MPLRWLRRPDLDPRAAITRARKPTIRHNRGIGIGIGIQETGVAVGVRRAGIALSYTDGLRIVLL